MREYVLEEILAEYAEKNLETAQPEEETAPPEEELTETADQLPDEEESILPEENEEDVQDTYGAGSAEATLPRIIAVPVILSHIARFFNRTFPAARFFSHFA